MVGARAAVGQTFGTSVRMPRTQRSYGYTHAERPVWCVRTRHANLSHHGARWRTRSAGSDTQ